MSQNGDSQSGPMESAAGMEAEGAKGNQVSPAVASAVVTSTVEGPAAVAPEGAAPMQESRSEETRTGPMTLEHFRRMRMEATAPATAPVSAGGARVGSGGPGGSGGQRGSSNKPGDGNRKKRPQGPREGEEDDGPRQGYDERSSRSSYVSKVEVPNIRSGLPEDLARELDAAITDLDFDKLLVGDASVQIGRRLEDGQRYSGRIIKIHNENVFLSLGGPDQGVVPLLQFNETPKEGDVMDCLIRGFNQEDGLYEVAIPGEAVTVSDWSDLDEGSVVEAKVESANTGGLEALVGSVRGFIPISQIAEYRVETPADFIGQKLLCVVVEANPRRGNLVLSHRALMERDKEAKKKERMASLEVGQIHEGTVRKVLDFGAFVDIGGLDGLIHISQLSWEKIAHPSEVVKEGDKVQVRVEKIDPETGKIGLSYRALQDHPWENIESKFPVGSVMRGTVSRIANFGAFVKMGTGIEGLIHLSELAYRRVSSVGNLLKEGQDVEVKILSADAESQRMSLSLKQAQAKPDDVGGTEAEVEEVVVEDTKKKSKKPTGPLKGGIDRGNGGEQFGLRW